MEAVAAARRELPPGGLIPEDYVFDGLGPDGKAVKVKLSELFAPGKDSLITYSFMFPRYPKDSRPGPTKGATARLNRGDGPCPSCTACFDVLGRVQFRCDRQGTNRPAARFRQGSAMAWLAPAVHGRKQFHARLSC